MHDPRDILDIPPFSLARSEKQALLSESLSALSAYHYDHCAEYRRMLDALEFDPVHRYAPEDIPFLPVRLFKDMDLKSVTGDEVFKTMTSSGTTGQRVSKIYLDKATAASQTKALSRIVADFIGKKRLPMLVIDSKSTVKDRRSFSARGAGILGFSMFGRDVTYALDENMRIDHAAIEEFCDKHGGRDTLVFGFTFIVYQQFIQPLLAAGRRLALDGGILIHGGGWKKLINAAVDNDTFKSMLIEAGGIRRVHNYYGMVEQTGSIFMECEEGRLHSPVFSDVIIRDDDFATRGTGEPGLIELVSVLPGSYPGHVLLSEDLGEILGEDDCPCGRKGKTFAVHGRVAKAEVRGCSDTFSQA